MPRRILIIHNPTAGKRRTALLDGVVAALTARGMAPEVVATEGPDHATDLAHIAEADLVVAAGGDGTINEVVHGLMTRARRAAGVRDAAAGDDQRAWRWSLG